MGEIDKPTYPTPMDMIEMWLNLDARDDEERLRRIKVLRRAIVEERENQHAELVMAGALPKALSYDEAKKITDNVQHRIADVAMLKERDRIRRPIAMVLTARESKGPIVTDWEKGYTVAARECLAIIDAGGPHEEV